MAEPLKNSFGARIPRTIAAQIAAVHPRFPVDAFIATALEGYDELELMARGRQIARSLARHLPADFERAVGILVASLGSRPERSDGDGGMASFLYLPHTVFIAENGLDHFEASMRAQHELTKRFTCEFSMRAFLDRHTEATLERLAEWTRDPDEHVRRLVSESTRPRLPWAPRLRRFQSDPRPVIALLERLRDDESLYVRRSVANNLNDIGKDHPALLMKTLKRWREGATPERQWLIRHALRSAVKRGDPGALALLGFGDEAAVSVARVTISPKRARIGESVRVSFELRNTGAQAQRVLADLRVHYVKAGGKTSAKTFKLKELEIAPGESARLEKKLSLAQMTTRKHYPGAHRVEAVLNGRVAPIGEFRVN